MTKIFQSPGSLSEFLNSKRDVALAAVANWVDLRQHRNLYLALLLLVLASLFLGFYHLVHNKIWIPQDVPHKYLYQLYTFVPIIISTSALGALLAVLFHHRTRNVFIILTFFSALYILQSIETPFWRHISLESTLNNVLATYAVFFISYYMVRERSFNFQFLFLLLISVVIIVTVAALNRSGFVTKGIWANQSNRLILVFSMFLSERISRRKDTLETGNMLSFFFSPAHLFTPIPISLEQVKSKGGSLSVIKGCYDLLLGAASLIIALFIENHFLTADFQTPAISTFTYGLINYTVYYLKSLAWIGLPIGICRLFGLKMLDYFDKPLLAANPADRWRKWNTYYYQWFYSFIFLPLQKKKHGLFFSVMAVFFATLVLHLGTSNFNLFLPSLSSLADTYLVKATVFFTLHGLLVYSSLKWNFLWPSSKSANGWWGVLSLHSLMIVIHIFAP